MSQRNPLNERYQNEDHTGVTRKSASSLKPKSKAASSVTIESTKKTPQQRKAEDKAKRKQEQAKRREIERKYYTPDTARYKKLRKIWWGALGGAIACTVLSFVLGQFATSISGASFAFLIAAYALIIFAFYIDFSKIRKERTAYQDRMIALEEKRARAERAAAREEGHHAKAKGSGKNASRNPNKQKKAAEAKAAEAKAAEAQNAATEAGETKDEAPAKRGFFGSGFRLSNREKMNAKRAEAKAKTATEEAADGASAGEAREKSAQA